MNKKGSFAEVERVHTTSEKSCDYFILCNSHSTNVFLQKDEAKFLLPIFWSLEEGMSVFDSSFRLGERKYDFSEEVEP